MRVYFEKPRTAIGWKGLINDPYLDDSFKIEDGLRKGRKLLLDIVELGLPTSTEALDPISPQYMQEVIAWSAIWCAHDRITDASRNVVWAFFCSRIQEWN